MNDNVDNTEKKQHRKIAPHNTLELKSLAKSGDKVFIYASKDDDGVVDDGVQ